MKITEAQIRLLTGGFVGPRPGSNFWPMLVLDNEGDAQVDGEDIDGWARQGFFDVWPAKDGRSLKGGETELYGEIPDIEFTHCYELNSAGRSALQPPATEKTG